MSRTFKDIRLHVLQRLARVYRLWPPFRKFRKEVIARLSELHFKDGEGIGEEMLVAFSHPEAVIFDEYREGRHPAVVAIVITSVWLPAHFIINEREDMRNVALAEFAEMHRIGDHNLPSRNPLVGYFRFLSDKVANWIDAGEVPTQVYAAFRLTYLKALDGEQYNMIKHIDANLPLTYLPKKNSLT